MNLPVELVDLALGVGGLLVTSLLGMLGFWAKSKIKNDLLNTLTVRAVSAVRLAVSEVSATYTEEIRKAREDGRLEPHEASEARNKALARAKDLLRHDGLGLLGWVVGLGSNPLASDKVLTSIVEHTLLERKALGLSAGASNGSGKGVGTPSPSVHQKGTQRLSGAKGKPGEEVSDSQVPLDFES